MKTSSGQVSAEFMILAGLVLIIFIPIFILIARGGIESAEQVSSERIGAIARTLLDESREIYYLGEGSRQTITLDVPRGVEAIRIVNVTDSSELLFSFVQGGIPSNISYLSEVPIRIVDSQSMVCDAVPDCGLVACDCSEFDVEGIDHLRSISGMHNFELRTQRDTGLYVQIRIV